MQHKKLVIQTHSAQVFNGFVILFRAIYFVYWAQIVIAEFNCFGFCFNRLLSRKQKWETNKHRLVCCVKEQGEKKNGIRIFLEREKEQEFVAAKPVRVSALSVVDCGSVLHDDPYGYGELGFYSGEGA